MASAHFYFPGAGTLSLFLRLLGNLFPISSGRAVGGNEGEFWRSSTIVPRTRAATAAVPPPSGSQVITAWFGCV